MSSQRGFSLMEVAVVLVVIGVLAGAVTKGMEYVEEAKYTQIKQSLQSISLAFHTYGQRYLSMAGDDNLADERFGLNSESGDGNRRIEREESAWVWLHLRMAGLLTGSGSQAPFHPWGGVFAFQYSNDRSHNELCLLALSGDQANILDASLDDGLPGSGQLQTLSSDSIYQSSERYDLCQRL